MIFNLQLATVIWKKSCLCKQLLSGWKKFYLFSRSGVNCLNGLHSISLQQFTSERLALCQSWKMFNTNQDYYANKYLCVSKWLDPSSLLPILVRYTALPHWTSVSCIMKQAGCIAWSLRSLVTFSDALLGVQEAVLGYVHKELALSVILIRNYSKP